MNVANFFIGKFNTDSGAPVFLNPATAVTDATWLASALAWAYTDDDPTLRIAGSIGSAVYFTRATGPFKAS